MTGSTPFGFAQTPLQDYLDAYDDTIALLLGLPRHARPPRGYVPPTSTSFRDMRVIRPGTLEWRAIGDRTPIQVGPADPCRFPGIAPKITTMQ